MSENSTGTGTDLSTQKSSTPAPAPTPAATPADVAPAESEATARLVLVPDAFTESFTAFVADVGQFRIDTHGTDVPDEHVEEIIEQAGTHGFIVKEA